MVGFCASIVKCGWSASSPVDLTPVGKPDCLRPFGVKLKNVRAARSTSVEAFRLHSAQARLPPAKDRAGFGEGVLQSHTPTDHSLIPRTPSRLYVAASNATQLHPQAHANFGRVHGASEGVLRASFLRC